MELSLSLLGAMDTPLPVSVAVFSVLFIVWALLVVPTGDGDDDDDMDTEEEESSDDGMDVEQGIGGVTHPSGDLGMPVPPAAAAAAAPVQPTENNLPTAAADTGRTRQVYSIAHTDMLAGKVVYIHVDLEHTGVHVCQLSAVITDANGTNLGTFDEYVRPPAHEWNTTGGILRDVKCPMDTSPVMHLSRMPTLLSKFGLDLLPRLSPILITVTRLECLLPGAVKEETAVSYLRLRRSYTREF